MTIEYSKWNHLTGCNRYLTECNDFHKDISSAIQSLNQRKIDPVGVLGILMKNYSIGDRTLVSGISKQPWMSKIENGNIRTLDLPKHDDLFLPVSEIANKLIGLMKNEAMTFLKGKKKIGILLSGGMDSRVIASIIKTLQDEGKYSGEVTALTWGVADCRDVLYSKRIADIYQWDFKHFLITPDTLFNNIIIAGERGAEYSPVHLHAMSDVSKELGIDGILAGSYGDSIGRGEYSGKKINDLPLLLNKHHNHYSFMLKEEEKKALKSIHSDIAKSRERFPGRAENSYREIEMQMHYMRRQLSSCMSIIDEKIPLYQMFTDPTVFGFMWSLSAECRTDAVYENILKKLSGKLLDIPWARDGKIYNSPNSKALDNYNKSYHRYGDWLRNDNRHFVINTILNGNLSSLNIFNEKSLNYWCNNWRKDHRPKADRLDEKMAWLASLSIFIGKYDLKYSTEYKQYTIKDQIHLYGSIAYESLYYNALTLIKK